MFKELYAVARHTPLHLAITPQEGGRMKVTVTPLPTGKAKDFEGLSKQFYALGTPEELDAEFLPKLDEYAGKVNEARAQIQLPEVTVEKTKKASASEKRAAAKAAKQAKKDEAAVARQKKADDAKAEKARKAQEAAERKAEKKSSKAGAAGITLPGAPAPTKTAAKPAAPAPEEKKSYLDSLPGKPEVLADFRALVAAHGAPKVGRKFFIKKAKTGRRYEKLWKNWADFMKWVARQPAAVAEPIEPADDRTRRMVAKGEKADAGEVDDKPVKGQSKTKFTDVYDAAGSYLSSITTKPVVGEHIGLVSQDKLLRITAIDERPSGGLDVTVVPDPEETARHAEAVAARVREQAAARQEKERPQVRVLDVKTRALIGTYSGPAKADELRRGGARIDVVGAAGKAYAVDMVSPDGIEILVHEVLAKPFMLFDDKGLKLGDSDAVYAAGDAVVELEGNWRISEVHAHDGAYTVRDASLKYQVFTEEEELITEYKSAPVVGERLSVPERAHPFKVLSVDGHRVVVRMVLPTKNRIVDQATNDVLGHTEEVYEVTDQVAELAPKDYRVVKVELDAYVVKLSKPRVVGPAATVAAA